MSIMETIEVTWRLELPRTSLSNVYMLYSFSMGISNTLESCEGVQRDADHFVRFGTGIEGVRSFIGGG